MFDFENESDREENIDDQQQIKNNIYSKAYRLAAKDDVDSLEQAVDLFASIHDFRDSAQRMSACQQKLSELKRELAIKKEKEEKKKTINITQEISTNATIGNVSFLEKDKDKEKEEKGRRAAMLVQ